LPHNMPEIMTLRQFYRSLIILVERRIHLLIFEPHFSVVL